MNKSQQRLWINWNSFCWLNSALELWGISNFTSILTGWKIPGVDHNHAFLNGSWTRVTPCPTGNDECAACRSGSQRAMYRTSADTGFADFVRAETSFFSIMLMSKNQIQKKNRCSLLSSQFSIFLFWKWKWHKSEAGTSMVQLHTYSNDRTEVRCHVCRLFV